MPPPETVNPKLKSEVRAALKTFAKERLKDLKLSRRTTRTISDTVVPLIMNAVYSDPRLTSDDFRWETGSGTITGVWVSLKGEILGGDTIEGYTELAARTSTTSRRKLLDDAQDWLRGRSSSRSANDLDTYVGPRSPGIPLGQASDMNTPRHSMFGIETGELIITGTPSPVPPTELEGEPRPPSQSP